MMTHTTKVTRKIRGGIMAGVVCTIAQLFAGAGWADTPPEGLPNSPEIPDLYDPAIVSTYTLVAKRPYQVHGHELAPWLVASILTSPVAHVGPLSVSKTGTAAVRGIKDVILVIGYVTDTRDGRIIALSETFGHPDDGTRSIKAWVDEGWIKTGKGSGEWGAPIRSETALSSQETAAFMEQVYRLIETGFKQTLRR